MKKSSFLPSEVPKCREIYHPLLTFFLPFVFYSSLAEEQNKFFGSQWKERFRSRSLFHPTEKSFESRYNPSWRCEHLRERHWPVGQPVRFGARSGLRVHQLVPLGLGRRLPDASGLLLGGAGNVAHAYAVAETAATPPLTGTEDSAKLGGIYNMSTLTHR